MSRVDALIEQLHVMKRSLREGARPLSFPEGVFGDLEAAELKKLKKAHKLKPTAGIYKVVPIEAQEAAMQRVYDALADTYRPMIDALGKKYGPAVKKKGEEVLRVLTAKVKFGGLTWGEMWKDRVPLLSDFVKKTDADWEDFVAREGKAKPIPSAILSLAKRISTKMKAAIENTSTPISARTKTAVNALGDKDALKTPEQIKNALKEFEDAVMADIRSSPKGYDQEFADGWEPSVDMHHKLFALVIGYERDF